MVHCRRPGSMFLFSIYQPTGAIKDINISFMFDIPSDAISCPPTPPLDPTISLPYPPTQLVPSRLWTSQWRTLTTRPSPSSGTNPRVTAARSSWATSSSTKSRPPTGGRRTMTCPWRRPGQLVSGVWVWLKISWCVIIVLLFYMHE